MSRKPKTVFVEKSTYRQRRMADAARLLPILGAALIMIPLLWSGNDAAPARTSAVMFYLFPVWFGLAVLAALVSRHLKTGSEDTQQDQGPQ